MSSPYELRRERRSRVLTWSDFQAGNQIQNIASPVATLDVPLNHMYWLQSDTPIRMYLRAVFTVTSGVLDASTTYVFNLAANQRVPIRSTRSAPSFPTSSHPDLYAEISSDGGTTWTAANVTAANFTTGSITISKNSGSTNAVRLFYLEGNGELEIRALRPLGSDRSDARLLNVPLRTLFLAEQSNVRTGFVLNLPSPEVVLPPQFRLSIDIRSPATFLWNAAAQHDIVIPIYEAPIAVRDAQTLNVMGEQGLRGGAF